MLTLIILSAFTLSIWYAWEIYKRTLEPQWVWAAVVIGNFLYCVTFGLFLYFLIADWTGHYYRGLIGLPLLWMALWGIPMILAELKKHFGMFGEASELKRPHWRGKRSSWD